MSDKVIELFKATDPRQRSTGEVAAPDLRARAHGTPDHMIEAALATSVERAAVVKYLRARAAYWRGTPLYGLAVSVLLEEADAVEKGEHL